MLAHSAEHAPLHRRPPPGHHHVEILRGAGHPGASTYRPETSCHEHGLTAATTPVELLRAPRIEATSRRFHDRRGRFGARATGRIANAGDDDVQSTELSMVARVGCAGPQPPAGSAPGWCARVGGGASSPPEFALLRHRALPRRPPPQRSSTGIGKKSISHRKPGADASVAGPATTSSIPGFSACARRPLAPFVSSAARGSQEPARNIREVARAARSCGGPSGCDAPRPRRPAIPVPALDGVNPAAGC